MVYGKYRSGVGEKVGGEVAVDVESDVAVGSRVSVNEAVTVGIETTGAQAASTNKSKTVSLGLLFILSPAELLLYPCQAL